MPVAARGASAIGRAADDGGATPPAIAEAATGTCDVADTEIDPVSDDEAGEVLANREDAERRQSREMRLGDRNLKIAEMVESFVKESKQKLRADRLMEAYERAVQATNVKLTTVRECWAIAWRFRFHRHLWLHALTPLPPKRKGFIDRHPELSAFLMGVILERKNQIGDGWLWRLAQAKFGLPPTREQTIKRACRALKKKFKVEIVVATNPDAARSRFMPAHGTKDAGVTEPLQIVEIDGSPLAPRRDRCFYAVGRGRRGVERKFQCAGPPDHETEPQARHPEDGQNGQG